MPQGAPSHPLERGNRDPGPGQRLNSAPLNFPETPPFPLSTLSLEILSHSWNGPWRVFLPTFGGPQGLLTSSSRECVWGRMGRTSARSSGEALLEAPLSVSLSESAQGT